MAWLAVAHRHTAAGRDEARHVGGKGRPSCIRSTCLLRHGTAIASTLNCFAAKKERDRCIPCECRGGRTDGLARQKVKSTTAITSVTDDLLCNLTN